MPPFRAAACIRMKAFHMSKPSIMIDGYNLALAKGTGIATYARNLSQQVSGLGHKVDILYGERNTVGKNAVLSEVGFFDPSMRSLSRSQIIRRLVTSPIGVTAKEVPISGSVISKNFRNRLPHFDRIFTARELYSFSRWHFRTYGTFLPVDYDHAADIAQWTYPLPLHLKKAANLYTIHDLVPLRLPYATLDNKKEFYKLTKRICEKADHIVTVSEVSKRDIIDIFGVDENRVTNTYQSVSLPEKILNRSADEVGDEVASIFNLDYKDYFLFFGAIEPKKNVGRIIEAYLASRVETPLVIVGQLVWRDADELRLLNLEGGKRRLRSRLSRKTGDDDNVSADPVEAALSKLAMLSASEKSRAESIVRLEYLPFPLLTSLIRGAKGVVFPSLYEGFGLPILEAMQLRTAVITGTEGSNPEVAGDAAMTVDPYDVQAIAQAIRTLDNDEDLRSHYEHVGLERAKVFSPEAYDERLKALYAKL